MATTVTSKGQVTIPKQIRDRLGIVPGGAVVFELDAHGRVVLRKATDTIQASRFESLRGCVGLGLSSDEIMILTRGE